MHTEDQVRALFKRIRPEPPPPTKEEVLAAPYNPYDWLDPDFPELLDKAIDRVGWPRTVDSQEWRTAVASSYERIAFAFYKEGPVIPFEPATDEHLQE
jgi:hypothetical protein